MLYPLSYGAMNLFYRCVSSLIAGFNSAKRGIDRILLSIRLGSHRFGGGSEQLPYAIECVPRQARSHMRVQVGGSTHVRMA